MPSRPTPPLSYPIALLLSGIGATLLIALGHTAWQWPIVVWILASIATLLPPQWRQTWQKLRSLPRFLLLLTTLLIWIPSTWGHWLTMGAGSLFLVLAFKTLETHSVRDILQIGALILLGMGLAAWIRIGITLGFSFLAELTLILLAILWQTYIQQRIHEQRTVEPKDLLRLGGFLTILLAFLLPSMATLFFLLPRTPTPLWHWGVAGSAVSGFSPSLNPEKNKNLALDPAVAFRTQITGPKPNPNALYWSGAILEKDLGGAHWVPETIPETIPGTPQNPSNAGKWKWKENIVLTPGRHQFLFGITTPLLLQAKVPILHNSTGWKLRTDAQGPLRYQVWSGIPKQGSLTTAQKYAALQLPRQENPKIRQLAIQLERSSPSKTVQNIMHWFRQPFFHYSLNAPKAYPNGQTLADFLLHSHTGFCEYYAAGLATLLRIDGIPARVIVGYHGGQYDPIGGFWIVRQSMAHAWVQAWLHGRWKLLDATPAATGPLSSNNAAEMTSRSISWLSAAWNWMQWNWLNWIIDFTPAKQRALWLDAGQFAQNSFTHKIHTKFHLPTHWMQQAKSSAGIPASLIAVALLILFLRRKKPKNDTETYYRNRAVKILQRYGLKDTRPGREEAWIQGRISNPEDQQTLKTAIYQQRYGKRPSVQGEQEMKRKLQSILRK